MNAWVGMARDARLKAIQAERRGQPRVASMWSSVADVYVTMIASARAIEAWEQATR